MTRFEVITHILAPPERIFAESLSVEAHTASMSASGERAVAGVTSGRLALGDQVTWRARHFVTWHLTSAITAAPAGVIDRAPGLGRIAEALVLRRHMTRLILRRNHHLKTVTERR